MSPASRRAPARKVLADAAAGDCRCAGRAAAARGRRGDRRQDQHDRVRVLRRRHPIRISARRAIRPTARACPAARRRAPRSRSPTACARSPSAPTPAARCAFRRRCAASSASSRAGSACRPRARFRCATTLDSIGPLARSVADCAKADAVMAGEEFVPLEPAPLAGLRFGIAARLAAGPIWTRRSARASMRR